MCARGVFVRRVVAIGCALCVLATTMLSAAERPLPLGPADRSTDPSAAPCLASAPRLPKNVRVDRYLLPRITEMLRRSATFRQQCRRLAAAPWAHVGVKLNPQLFEAQSYRALSVIQRPQPRLIVAQVTLQALSDPAMWLAHELEHVLEQVDDVDVEELATRKRSAWRVGIQMFETQRAIAAGEAVAAEVRTDSHERNAHAVDHGSEPDNFVE